MSVETTHPTYDTHAPDWWVLRTVTNGQRAVHEAGEAMLPKLGGQDSVEYQAYKQRTLFLNATARTVDGLSGLIFRKPPLLTHPETMQFVLDDVTMTGLTFQAFAENLVEEVLKVSRAGILVDVPPADAQIRTVADARRRNVRPFWRLYQAEQILSWRIMTINNEPRVQQIRLHETIEEPGASEFELQTIAQIRVLDLDDSNLYRQRIFRRSDRDKTEWVQVGDDILPLMNGQRLEQIPFVFIGSKNTDPTPDKPLLLDLAHVNVRHYQLYADFSHALHFGGAPTPVVTGHREKEGEDYKIGSAVAWVFPEPEAKASYLAFDATTLSTHQKELESLKQDMAVLGARILAQDKRQVEAAETVQLHRLGENSVLSSLAQAVSLGLTDVLDLTRAWMGLVEDQEVSVQLNRDFLPTPMSDRKLVALVQALQGGTISKQTFFENLQRGEVIAADRSFDDEQAAIETEAPALSRSFPEEEDDEPEPDDEA